MGTPLDLALLDAALPSPARGSFTSRAGGLSPAPYAGLNLALHVGDDAALVTANRDRLADAVGLAPRALVFAEQVHGPGVAVVDGPVAGPLPGVDALVTATRGLGLCVLAADCLPVLLADPVAGVVAAAHAGRQGLAAGVLQATLAAMSRLGARPADTVAALGPAACGRCYEVPVAMADEVEAAVPGSRGTTRQATASVDLAAGAEGVLARAGLLQVNRCGLCTLEQQHLYSYRRDGRTGRHGGVALLS